MRRPTLVVLVVFAAALAAATVHADVVLAIHGHSLLSDGKEQPYQAAASMRSGGAQVAILTDHAECIRDVGEWKRAIGDLSNPATLVSTEAFRSFDISQAPAEACVIPALECGLIARSPDKPTDRRCHFLFIGGSLGDDTYDRVVQLIQSGQIAKDDGSASKALEILLSIAREHGAVVIAAHPTNPSWRIDSGLLTLVDGVEAMNHSLDPTMSVLNTDPRELRDLPENLLQEAVWVPALPLVTAGLDWHGLGVQCGVDSALRSEGEKGLVQKGLYLPTPERFTVVLTDGKTPEAIVQALRERRCYAAFGKARITQGKELIGGEIALDKPFEMRFEGISGKKAWLVCRSSDGISCRGPVEVLMKGNRLSGRLDELLGIHAGGMNQGGWVVVAAPAGSPQVITSGIRVLPAKSDGAGGSFVFYDKPITPDQTPSGTSAGSGAEASKDFGNWPIEYRGCNLVGVGPFSFASGTHGNSGRCRLGIDPVAQRGMLELQLNDWSRRVPLKLAGEFPDMGANWGLVKFESREAINWHGPNWDETALVKEVRAVLCYSLPSPERDTPRWKDPFTYWIEIAVLCSFPSWSPPLNTIRLEVTDRIVR